MNPAVLVNPVQVIFSKITRAEFTCQVMVTKYFLE